MRNATIFFSALFVVGCVRVGHIQQSAPVRSTTFTGSHKVVAQCIQGRTGGRVQDESFGERYVVYNSTKGQHEGLTHWAMTIGNSGSGQGFVEMRIVVPPPSVGALGAAPGGANPYTQQNVLAETAVANYWRTVLSCIEQVK
jgi:hypothetical protein